MIKEDKDLDSRENDGEERGMDLAELASNFLRIAKRLWWLFLLLCAVGVGLMYAVSYINYTPVYRSEVSFIITASDGSSLFGTTNSVNSASQLSKTFPYILDSDYFHDVLLDALGQDELNGTIEAQIIDGSNLITMQVESPSPEDARAILEKALEVYPSASRFALGDIRFNMIDEVSTSTEPVNAPSPHRIWGFGLTGGIVVAALVVGLMALFSNTIKSAQDMESVSSMACLGALPEVRTKARKKNAGSRLVSVLDLRSTHGFRESVRAMEMRVLDALEEADAKTILVTSSVAGEGKSTVAINLAEQLAQDGFSVLLVDMDLRKQGDAALLGCEGCQGLADVIGDKDLELESCIIALQDQGIDFLGGAQPVGNPIRTLSDESLPRIIEELGERWDYVVFDAPSSAVFQDASMIANLVDAVLFVVRFDYVTSRNLREALSMLESSATPLLGYVLNACPQSTGGYGYGYGRYGYGKYGYGAYGAGYGSKEANGRIEAPGGRDAMTIDELPQGRHWRK